MSEPTTTSGSTPAPGTPGEGTAAPATTPAPGTGPTQPPAGEKGTALTTEPTTTEGEKGAPTGQGEKPTGPEAGEIQITVPKGVTDTSLLDGFKGVAKELGLKSEQAQKVADWYFKEAEAAIQKARTTQEEQVVRWAEEAKADKEIGGANFDANLKIAQHALRQFGSDDLTKMLNETGLGNHKAMISLFARVGRAISEDRLPKGPVAAGEGQKQEKPLEQTLYPTMYPDT